MLNTNFELCVHAYYYFAEVIVGPALNVFGLNENPLATSSFLCITHSEWDLMYGRFFVVFGCGHLLMIFL